jgi:hypothetical protein
VRTEETMTASSITLVLAKAGHYSCAFVFVRSVRL